MEKAQKYRALEKQGVLNCEVDYGDSSSYDNWIAKWGFWSIFAFIWLEFKRKPGF